MKILLDESVPQKLRLLIDPRRHVVTTWCRGWSGLKNGSLLAVAEPDGFELFVTADQEIAYQRNLTGRHIAILVLSTNNWSVIQTAFAQIALAIEKLAPGAYSFLDIGSGAQ